MLGGLCSGLLGHSDLCRFWAGFDHGLGGKPHRASGNPTGLAQLYRAVICGHNYDVS